MANIPKYKNEKGNAANFLKLSLTFSKEYFNELCELQKKHSKADIELSKELTIIHRALWTALIVEIRKLFGKSFNVYENYSLKEISFFKEEPYKTIVDQVYGDQIVQKIIKTSNTFTIHLAKENMDILSVDEICKSNLGQRLEELQKPMEAFEELARATTNQLEFPRSVAQ